MSDQIIPALIAFVLVSILSPLFIATLKKIKAPSTDKERTSFQSSIKKRYAVNVWDDSFCRNYHIRNYFTYAIHVFLGNYLHSIQLHWFFG